MIVKSRSKHQSWTLEIWKKVMWCDESSESGYTLVIDKSGQEQTWMKHLPYRSVGVVCGVASVGQV